MLGRSLYRAPNPPVVDCVTPRLGESFDTSGEKYILAKEFGCEVGTTPRRDSEFEYLVFVWGGTNQPRNARDRIALIEDGIRKSGVFRMHTSWSLPHYHGVRTIEYSQTNQCAVIRDAKGLVKIVPINCLSAYVDAGLVRLPNAEPVSSP
jgi:hypothetical protein